MKVIHLKLETHESSNQSKFMNPTYLSIKTAPKYPY